MPRLLTRHVSLDPDDHAAFHAAFSNTIGVSAALRLLMRLYRERPERFEELLRHRAA